MSKKKERFEAARSALLKRTKADVENRYGIGGRPKANFKPVTRVPLRWLEAEPPPENKRK